MKTYRVDFKGYSPDNSETENFFFWVGCDTQQTLEEFVEGLGITAYVQEIAEVHGVQPEFYVFNTPEGITVKHEGDSSSFVGLLQEMLEKVTEYEHRKGN